MPLALLATPGICAPVIEAQSKKAAACKPVGFVACEIVKTHESCLQGIARTQASSVYLDPQLQRRQGIVGYGLSSASQPGTSKHSPQSSWCAVAEPSRHLLASAPCALPQRPAFLPYRSSLSSGRSGRALCVIHSSLRLLRWSACVSPPCVSTLCAP